MISKITSLVISNIHHKLFTNFQQISDNTAIFQFLGDNNKYKISITRVKNS
jgi:hypothetical protein